MLFMLSALSISVPVQIADGSELFAKPAAEISEPDITEIPSRQTGEQHHADVGRRGPMGDICTRLFLIVIGWQPMILWPDERFEEQPGASRQPAKECDLTPIERFLVEFWALTDPVGDFWRK